MQPVPVSSSLIQQNESHSIIVAALLCHPYQGLFESLIRLSVLLHKTAYSECRFKWEQNARCDDGMTSLCIKHSASWFSALPDTHRVLWVRGFWSHCEINGLFLVIGKSIGCVKFSSLQLISLSDSSDSPPPSHSQDPL